MNEDLRFNPPEGMQPKDVAETFAAYLLGPRAFENRFILLTHVC